LIMTRWPRASPSTSAMRSPYRTSVPRAGRRRMLAWVRFVGIAQEGFCNTYDYAHCGACAASNCRGISRAFQILGFCYAPNRCASLTRSWQRRVRFNQHPIRGIPRRIQRRSDILARREPALSTNWLLVSLLCGSQDASDIREPAKQDGSLRKMAAIGLSNRII